MKLAYVDTSVLVTLLFKESGAAKIHNLLLSYDEIFSSHLIEAELASVASREKIDMILVKKILDNVSLIMPDRSLYEEYTEIFAKGYCRGADAYHLACALYLDDKEQKIHFLSHDRQQTKVASSCGLNVPGSF